MGATVSRFSTARARCRASVSSAGDRSVGGMRVSFPEPSDPFIVAARHALIGAARLDKWLSARLPGMEGSFQDIQIFSDLDRFNGWRRLGVTLVFQSLNFADDLL
jgi:hypothetical protein